MRNFSLIALLSIFAGACVTSTSSTGKFGIQEAYRSYIPAKTAVLACRFWPETSNFAAHPRSNSAETDRKEFCPVVDAYVLDGFKGQNFMRGHSPKAVARALSEKAKLELLDDIPHLWHLQADKSRICSNIPCYYNEIVKSRIEWRQWLLEFSAATHQTDAILIPFVAFAREEKENDRGLLLAKRSMGLVLLLIDIQTGDLIWSGTRQSLMSAHRLVNQSELTYPEFPQWSGLVRELLIDGLWREYPGKIFL